MTTGYPGALDTTATHPAAAGVGANLGTFPHSALHGNANDAIIAIQTELGVNPSGASSSVAARFDDLDSLTIFQRSADVSIAAFAAYDVVWDAETLDPDGWGSIGSANLTCPATGLYMMKPYATGTIGGDGAVSVPSAPTLVSGTSIDLGNSFQYATAGAVFKVTASNSASTTGTLTHAAIYIARLR